MSERAQAATPRSPAQPGGLPIGVSIGSIGATPQWWVESAKRLEAAGYRGIWSWDHFVGKGDKRVPVTEQWTTLSVVAGATSSIGLGTFVTNVMNRHPAVVARMASTLQLASGGRLTLGIGIGGGAPEHRAYGIDFPAPEERAARLEEAVAVIRALWTGGPVTRASPYYPLSDAHAFPVPDPSPRILIGAGTPAGARLAARVGDGWAAEIEGFETLLQPYTEALATEGRRIDDVWIALGFGGGKSGEDALGQSPWVERPREEWARWRERGVDEIIVSARTPNDIDALIGAVDRW